jgi:hypothetical protein
MPGVTLEGARRPSAAARPSSEFALGYGSRAREPNAREVNVAEPFVIPHHPAWKIRPVTYRAGTLYDRWGGT